jgi:hypothetical protein
LRLVGITFSPATFSPVPRVSPEAFTGGPGTEALL